MRRMGGLKVYSDFVKELKNLPNPVDFDTIAS